MSICMYRPKRKGSSEIRSKLNISYLNMRKKIKESFTINTFYELFKIGSQKIDTSKLQNGRTGKRKTRWKDKLN